MISILASGTLLKDPRHGVSSSGKRWANGLVRCPVSGVKAGENQHQLVSVACFEDQADRLIRLRQGDSVSFSGQGKLVGWEKDGVERQQLEVIAQEILSIYQARKRKQQNNRDDLKKYGAIIDDDFNDEISF